MKCRCLECLEYFLYVGLDELLGCSDVSILILLAVTIVRYQSQPSTSLCMSFSFAAISVNDTS